MTSDPQSILSEIKECLKEYPRDPEGAARKLADLLPGNGRNGHRAATQDQRGTERPVPPNDAFPATVHFVPAQADKLAEFRFEVEGPRGLYTFSRRLQPGRRPRWLVYLWKTAGLKAAAPLEALEGRRVLIEGERRWYSGNLIWVGRRFLELSNDEPSPPAEGTASPDTEPVSVKTPADRDIHDVRADSVIRKLQSAGATFFPDEGHTWIALPRRDPIPIIPGSNEYASIQLACVGLGTVEYKGKILVQRVAVRAAKLAVPRRRLQFSFADARQILVPVEGGKLLRIAADGFSLVSNGTSGIRLEHPRGKPMAWNEQADPIEGLRKFDELLVNTLAIPSRPLRSLLAAALGMVPFVRQRVNARPILELTGLSGMGKSTGAERFLRLHAMGPIQGDYSLAQAKRDGDTGLLIRDNVESENLTRGMEDYFLFAATGGEWARVGAGRAEDHPIVAVTSVEGIGRRPEVNRRLIRFEFQHEPKQWPEESIRADIDTRRTVMFRGAVEVLKSMMAQNPPPEPPSIPMTDFGDYCVLLYRLLRAWEDVAGKPAGFADEVFRAWGAQQNADELKDSAGVYPRLLEVLIARRNDGDVGGAFGGIDVIPDYARGELQGRLYKATPNTWLTVLKGVAERDVRLPSTPEGLRRRLMELKPCHGFVMLTDKKDDVTLKRNGSNRWWGILEIDPGG